MAIEKLTTEQELNLYRRAFVGLFAGMKISNSNLSFMPAVIVVFWGVEQGIVLAIVLSIIDHLDDFTKGVIDTTHLIYYVSFTSFGLFLTARSVDTERWKG